MQENLIKAPISLQNLLAQILGCFKFVIIIFPFVLLHTLCFQLSLFH